MNTKVLLNNLNVFQIGTLFECINTNEDLLDFQPGQTYALYALFINVESDTVSVEYCFQNLENRFLDYSLKQSEVEKQIALGNLKPNSDFRKFLVRYKNIDKNEEVCETIFTSKEYSETDKEYFKTRVCDSYHEVSKDDPYRFERDQFEILSIVEELLGKE